ncbi:MAG: thymidine phosphorylase [candidate division KSB1 bacterium]|nr:thymidine phosphorylase [candidate division KSB1 bacterium]MDZ7273694.1 thymidine phosphorylase [candidate division KSB1 bacterium]MDZ7285850.1 thymidine phosphorylase [candidate division KSB1 bacterium]MDZ7298882.1 thymidine phosphorylase [candidate division KSB1 bacterium]MDZ7307072.1 thymidine phosphorylase [candidate division KSB1 bacterium]
MNAVEIITKKRDGLALSEDEIEFVITAYLADQIPDYQMAALLMAIYFRGMDERETVTLTRLMRDSGVVLRHPTVTLPKVDKHSTGGVGDKVSLILAPLMAAAGIAVPMISGRSLAHTGGTLDKLEAIPGFQTQLPLEEFQRLTAGVGACLIGQTENICPADRRIYALRDVTGTVPSMPLICASILSKKLAEGIDALVLDVKTGNGAIFSEAAAAEELATRLIRTARHFNLPTIALLTDMSQPLGNTIGNWVEVCEAIAVLQGRGPRDTRRVTLALGAAMLKAAGKVTDLHEGARQLGKLLDNGAAWRKFVEIVAAQHGQVEYVEDPGRYPRPRYTQAVQAKTGGYVVKIDARALGQLAMTLGAGRVTVHQKVDPLAGITLNKKVGEAVAAGETLAVLQSSTVALEAELAELACNSFVVAAQAVQPPPLLIARLEEDGRHELAGM